MRECQKLETVVVVLLCSWLEGRLFLTTLQFRGRAGSMTAKTIHYLILLEALQGDI